MSITSRPWASVLSIFSRNSAPSRRRRGARRCEVFYAHFDGGHGGDSRGTVALGCDMLEQRVVLTASPAADFDFLAGTITAYHGAGGSVTIPTVIDGLPVRVIGNAAFQNNGQATNPITSVVIPNSVVTVGDNAFAGVAGLRSVTIGNRVTSIGASAFEDCTGLIALTIPNRVTSVGAYAFSDASSLTSLRIGNHVRSIGSYAFFGTSSLASVTIGSGVTSIGANAFQGSGLTSVRLPAGLTSIGDIAFSGSARLTSVTFTGNAPSVGVLAFGFIGSNAKAYRAADLTGYGADGGDFHGLIVATPVG